MIQTSPSKQPSAFHAWVVLIAASLMFFYTFIQMNMLNPIDSTLMHVFNVSASQLGILSSMYFWGNFLLLFPAGLILDRYSPKWILFVALLVASLSMFTFAMSTSLMAASISRLVMGFCGSFGFLGAIRIVSRWFPPKRMALASGSIVTFAMLGGVVAQTPIAKMSAAFGWQHALVIFGFLGLALVLLELLFVRDYPASYEHPAKSSVEHISSLGFWRSITMVVGNRYNWFGGLYTTLMNLPIFVSGALWGNMYLMQTQHLSTIQASDVTAELFFGTLIGAPLIGWISDKMKRRVLPMMIGAVVSLIIVLFIIYLLNISFVTLLILFFLLGLITSTQVLSYPTITELNSPLVTGSAISIISLLIMASGVISQPLFGWILDLKWNHLVVKNVAIYSVDNFRAAMWIIPIGFIASLVVAFFIKETFCTQQFNE